MTPARRVVARSVDPGHAEPHATCHARRFAPSHRAVAIRARPARRLLALSGVLLAGAWLSWAPSAVADDSPVGQGESKLVGAAPELTPALARQGPPVWSDEFEGTTLDLTRWSYRATGPRGDGTLTPDAVSVGDGVVTIKAYTDEGRHHSGMISTQRHGSAGFEQAYGYFEARARFESASGQWSAFWLQSPTIGSPLGDPATAGVEMDVAEARARCVTASTTAASHACSPDVDISDRIQQAVIWDGYGPQRKAVVQLSDPLAGLGAGSWHTWAVSWTPTKLTFYYDDIPTWSTSGPISRRAQYVILSSEVDAAFAGAIPAAGYGSREQSTTGMQVDYVRVWGAPAPGTGTPVAGEVPTVAPVAGDHTAPEAVLLGRARQKLGPDVAVTIACRDERCRATATGVVRVPGRHGERARAYTSAVVATTIAKGAKVRVRLRLSKRARGAIARALRARRRIVVKLGVSVTDDARNIRPLTRNVALEL
jgi:beta-glucanase (GH16 family)